uniref:Gamma-glutamylcyclotransferase family protein n=1 Tax=Saccoglossus kowalevskii TaxID=10224 RepID=A0ABM0N0E1_SACKO|nr:PREDICTED: putative gamma-glutamylcyclotransferase CG2811-like [Saccoglossus kowalevskii]
MADTGDGILHRIFVYGTLKKGQPNHNLITNPYNGTAIYIGKARSVDRWPLVVASALNIPVILDKIGHGQEIQGELYDVDDNKLTSCDYLEDHPRWYLRRKIDVELSTKPVRREHVWAYVMHNFKEEFLDLPMLKSYDAEDFKFILPSERSGFKDVISLFKR